MVAGRGVLVLYFAFGVLWQAGVAITSYLFIPPPLGMVACLLGCDLPSETDAAVVWMDKRIPSTRPDIH